MIKIKRDKIGGYLARITAVKSLYKIWQRNMKKWHSLEDVSADVKIEFKGYYGIKVEVSGKVSALSELEIFFIYPAELTLYF